MNVVLILALLAAMAATMFALIRGIVAFLQTTKEELNAPDGGPSPSSLKQNKMMFNRILFQALAIIIVVLILLMSGGGK